MSKCALGQRIETLEAQLSAVSSGTSPVAQDRPQRSPSTTTNHVAQSRNPLNGTTTGVLGFLTFEPYVTSEPAYLGPSSGSSILEHLGRITHDAEFCSQSLPVATSKLRPEPPSNTDNNLDGGTPPDDATGSLILNAYFKNIHLRLPFLSRAEILDLHARRYQLSDSNGQQQFGMFKIFMVYAIGASVLQLTEASHPTHPGSFSSTALKFDSMARGASSIHSIEALMLLVIYKLRSSTDSSVWYNIGLAMRTCIDLGLHREGHYRKLKPCHAELKRRLFWSVYLLERYVASSLGRPFSIAEEEIDAELPSDLDDSIKEDSLIVQTVRDGPKGPGSDRASNLSRFIASIRLRRISSKIQSRIYRVDKNLSLLQPQVAPLLASLEEYERTLPNLAPAENDWVHMHWNNAIRVLLQPFLTILEPADRLMVTCMHASGQVCQLFKSMRQRDSAGYCFLLVNSVFMSGLTMWSVTCSG